MKDIETRPLKKSETILHYNQAQHIALILKVRNIDRELLIPAFSSYQIVAALRIMDMVGNDVFFLKALAGFLLARVNDYNAFDPKNVPSNKLYAEWLKEFRAREGMITGPVPAIGEA